MNDGRPGPRRLRALPSPLLVGLTLGLGLSFAATAGLPRVQVALVGVGLWIVALAVLEARRGLGAGVLELRREIPPGLAVGRPAEITLHLGWRGRQAVEILPADGPPVLLGATPESGLLRLPPGGSATHRYPVLPIQRGRWPFDPVWVRVRPHLALVEHRLLFDLPEAADVGPDVHTIREASLRARRDLLSAAGGRRTRLAGRDGDFERLREFVPGDDLRHMDWKVTARVGRPMVRVYQAEKAQNIVILIDGTRLMGGRSERASKIDHAVDACLALAWVAIQHGDRVGVCVFDENVRVFVPPGQGPAHMGRIRRAVLHQGAMPAFPRYGEAATYVARHLRRRGLFVWLTDLMDGEQSRELLLALRALRGRHLSLVLALDDPELQAMARAEPKDLDAAFAQVAAMEAEDERDALLRRLRREGAQVQARAPDQAAVAAVDRYLDLKQRGAL